MELPIAKDSCKKCVRKVTARQDALQCDICNHWWHRTCGTSLSHAAYTEISRQIRQGIPYEWSCDECKAQVATPVTESTRIDCKSVPQQMWVLLKWLIGICKPFVQSYVPSGYITSHLGRLSRGGVSDVERVQKRCLKVIYPKLSYSKALEESGLVRLDTRREDITQSTFKELKCPTHPLHYMLPPHKVSTSQMTLRPTYLFSAPKCKKTRYGRDLIPYCIANKY